MTRRPQDCEYTDKQGRTYTEVLEERLSQLKIRVQELENPAQNSAPVLLHDPYAAPACGSLSSGQAPQSWQPGSPNVSLSRPWSSK